MKRNLFFMVCISLCFITCKNTSKEIVNALAKVGKDVSFCEIKSPYGHDAFLLEADVQTKIIKSFLSNSED